MGKKKGQKSMSITKIDPSNFNHLIKIHEPMYFKRNICRSRKTGQYISYIVADLTPEERSQQLLKRKLKAIAKKDPYAFLTLTFSNEGLLKSGNLRNVIRKFFNKLKLYMSRSDDLRQVARSKFDYIWKIEFGSLHQRPHFHCMVSTYIDQNLIIKAWGLGGVQIKQIETQKQDKWMAINYLNKYFSKQEIKPKYSKQRRFGISRGWNTKYQSEWQRVGFDVSNEPMLELTEEELNEFRIKYEQYY